jgi:UDP-N-acetylmuramate--alanine ligase
MTHYSILGIAGAGMSAIANILLDQGHRVSGTDAQHSAFADALVARGAAIRFDEDETNLAGVDALIVTSAARPDHPAISAAQARGIPVLKRADLWREWSQQRAVVAVAGTHGKTTTTAMIALALTHAGRDPGFLIGAEIPQLGTNARWGDPQAPLVIEADEYDRTFLALAPQLAVITNVEWDHVDIYRTQDEYEAAFRTFAGTLRDPQRLIVCGDDAGAERVVAPPDATWYGIDEQIARDPVSCRRTLFDWTAANVRSEAERTRFDLWRYDTRTFATRNQGERTILVPGAHNVRNAIAAIAVATALGVPQDVSAAALATYSGAGRRFELKGVIDDIMVIDDYAHHPTEVRATLAAARGRYPDRRIVAYFQPHTYSRTRELLGDWALAFSDADIVRVGEIYAARERDTLGNDKYNYIVAERIEHPNVRALDGVEQAAAQLLNLLQPGDLLLTLSAGDGYRVGEMILAALDRKQTQAL